MDLQATSATESSVFMVGRVIDVRASGDDRRLLLIDVGDQDLLRFLIPSDYSLAVGERVVIETSPSHRDADRPLVSRDSFRRRVLCTQSRLGVIDAAGDDQIFRAPASATIGARWSPSAGYHVDPKVPDMLVVSCEPHPRSGSCDDGEQRSSARIAETSVRTFER